jgi:hypothetical protein
MKVEMSKEEAAVITAHMYTNSTVSNFYSNPTIISVYQNLVSSAPYRAQAGAKASPLSEVTKCMKMYYTKHKIFH